MQPVTTLNYCLVHTALFLRHKNPHVGVGTFHFFFVSVLVYLFVCAYQTSLLPKGLSLLFLLSMNRHLFRFLVVSPIWTGATEPETGLAALLLACTDLGELLKPFS